MERLLRAVLLAPAALLAEWARANPGKATLGSSGELPWGDK